MPQNLDISDIAINQRLFSNLLSAPDVDLVRCVGAHYVITSPVEMRYPY